MMGKQEKLYLVAEGIKELAKAGNYISPPQSLRSTERKPQTRTILWKPPLVAIHAAAYVAPVEGIAHVGTEEIMEHSQ